MIRVRVSMWTIPWKILNYVNNIQSIVAEHGFSINHCFREFNQFADKLANLSHTFDNSNVQLFC